MSAFYKSTGGIEGYLLENNLGISVEIITLGARIHKLKVPTRNGNTVDVVAGFNTYEDYRGDNPYFNAVIGRVANRIGGASFELGGKRYNLSKNDGENHLHGGLQGFDKQMWQADKISNQSVRLSYLSPEGEYPGNLQAEVKYSLNNAGELTIEYLATSDKDTLCNLTSHAYFNLSGEFDTVLDHEVYINSDTITDVDSTLIPTGRLLAVSGTPYDFTRPKTIGKDIRANNNHLKAARGYDINYVLNSGNPAAKVHCPSTGIAMEVLTDMPCMQFYTGNFLHGLQGKKAYGYQSAFCMETQGYPNACNTQSFPSIILKAGEKYKTRTTYRFLNS